MKRIEFLKGLAAGVVGLAGILGNYSQSRVYGEESKVVASVKDENKKVMYRAAEDYLYDFMRGDENRVGYIDFMAKHSDEIRKNIKLTSRDEVIEGYVQFHRMCLDFAVSHLFQKVSDKEVSDLAEKMRQHQKTLAKETYIDYENQKVKDGYLPLARNRIEFFKKVFEANINSPSGDFKGLIRSTFTKEGFKKSLMDYKEARRSLYEGFSESLKSYHDPNNRFWAWLVRIFGPGIANNTMKKSDEINGKELERVYGKD